MKKISREIMKASFVYICGNGGSASTANHFANDLVKMCAVRAVSLCSNEAIVMAYANDDGYDSIFINQLEVFLERGDLLITISGSGTSGNIMKAKEHAKFRGNTVCSFPTMKEMNMDMQRIEDYHLKLTHEICDELK